MHPNRYLLHVDGGAYSDPQIPWLDLRGCKSTSKLVEGRAGRGRKGRGIKRREQEGA